MQFPYLRGMPRISDTHLDDGRTDHSRTIWLDLRQESQGLAPLYCTICDDYVQTVTTGPFDMFEPAQKHLRRHPR